MTFLPAARRLVVCAFVVLFGLFATSCDAGGPAMEPEDDPDPPDEESGPDPSVQLTAAPDGETVALTWSGSGLGPAPMYRLYRARQADFDTTGAFYVALAATEYRDEDVETEQTYHYRVAAFDGASGAPLALSASASARPKDQTPPPAPSGLRGAGGFYRATLTWAASPASDVAGYHVYRLDQPFSDLETAQRLTETPIDSIGFRDASVLDGERYHYRITAVDERGNESPPSGEVAVTPTFAGDAVRGERLFAETCAICHVARDAWDLQSFAMPDTMIHRRARAHVSEQEAFDIIRFVHSGDVEPLRGSALGEAEVPPFQPGGHIAESDRAFAVDLFGADRWPEDMTEEELLAIDPQTLPVPLPMPRWSVEETNQDWMPNEPLPTDIKSASAVQSALDQYRASASDANLVRVLRAFNRVATEGEKFPGEHGTGSRADFEMSFDLYRWVSVLAAQHLLRDGRTALTVDRVDGRPMEERHFGLTSPWWRVGDIMRRFEAFRADAPADVYQTAARWFYLAWSLRQDVVGHEQKYMSVALDRGFGLKRLSAFSLAYGIVGGAPNNHHLYTDLVAVHRHTPTHWQADLMIFLLEHLIDRWEGGDMLQTAQQRHHAYGGVEGGVQSLLDHNAQITSDKRARIVALRDTLLRYIDE
jgi:hypothetical protein